MNKKNCVLQLLTLLLFPAIFVSCNTSSPKGNVVSVSIAPLQYFVDRLTDHNLEVNVMVPTGSSHGTYSPTARQMQKLSDSGIYFQVPSLGYEQAFIRRLKDLNPDIRHVDFGKHITLIRGERIAHGDHFHEGGIDPHIWMSPAVMLELLPVMRDALIEAYPVLRAEIDAAYPGVFEEVQTLHLQMQETVSSLSQRKFLIFHPALTYLARDYGMEQISIEHEGKEPSVAQLMLIIANARAEAVPVIFIQEEYDVRNAQLVAQETGAHIVQINPLGYDWMHEMQLLMTTFNSHLK